MPREPDPLLLIEKSSNELDPNKSYLAYCRGINHEGDVILCWRRVSYSQSDGFVLLEKGGMDIFKELKVKRIFDFPTL